MSRKHLAIATLSGTLLFAAQGILALPWNEDMRDQPSIKPQESEVRMNEDSVPVQDDEPMRPPTDLMELVYARLAAGKVSNPIARSVDSINRGKQLYEIHCLVCHGPEGRGDGPVGKKYVPDPMNLTLEYVQNQPDGQIFYTISHGSIAMPFYRDSIPAPKRWDVVNYIKAVIGQTGK